MKYLFEGISLIFGGPVVTGRKYPWAGAFFHKGILKYGGNLGRIKFKSNKKT
jgi:hypothetical protein